MPTPANLGVDWAVVYKVNRSPRVETTATNAVAAKPLNSKKNRKTRVVMKITVSRYA